MCNKRGGSCGIIEAEEHISGSLTQVVATIIDKTSTGRRSL